jgi:aminoglycoside phosphotransferase (APT) family kinase protein
MDNRAGRQVVLIVGLSTIGASGTMTPVQRAKAGPPGGRAWQPGRRWNDIRWDGEAVVKRITRDDARRRRDVEAGMLTRLAGVVPVPRAFPSGDPFAVRMEYVPGPLAEQWFVSGFEARGVEEGVRRQVIFLRGCGGMLRALHAFDARSFADVLGGEGASVIHADPGPYNVIVDPESGRIRALIDWELARIGDPVEDLALVEWNMRIWYQSAGDVLRHLYDAYGSLPVWSRRHAAMIERCRGYYASSRDDTKREQLRRTEAFEELC